MPWKQGYTISDEKSLADADVRWPDAKRCAIHIVVDLSVASGPEGIVPRDLASEVAVFAVNDGLDGLLDALARHGLRATFASIAEELVSSALLKRRMNHAAAGDVTLGHYLAKSEAQLRAGWQAVADFVEDAARRD